MDSSSPKHIDLPNLSLGFPKALRSQLSEPNFIKVVINTKNQTTNIKEFRISAHFIKDYILDIPPHRETMKRRDHK
jgi:hypothetical protein